VNDHKALLIDARARIRAMIEPWRHTLSSLRVELALGHSTWGGGLAKDYDPAVHWKDDEIRYDISATCVATDQWPAWIADNFKTELHITEVEDLAGGLERLIITVEPEVMKWRARIEQDDVYASRIGWKVRVDQREIYQTGWLFPDGDQSRVALKRRFEVGEEGVVESHRPGVVFVRFGPEELVGVPGWYFTNTVTVPYSKSTGERVNLAHRMQDIEYRKEPSPKMSWIEPAPVSG